MTYLSVFGSPARSIVIYDTCSYLPQYHFLNQNNWSVIISLTPVRSVSTTPKHLYSGQPCSCAHLEMFVGERGLEVRGHGPGPSLSVDLHLGCAGGDGGDNPASAHPVR